MFKIVHTELISNNAKATADFIAKMFGWQVKKWDNPKMEYYTWHYPGEEMGGGGIGSTTDQQGQNMPHIDIYVDVDNIAKALDKAKSLGATQVVGETEIGGGMGYFAVLQTPGGCNLGLWAKVPSTKHETQPAGTQKK